MENRLGNRLCRLVREHAYLSGSLPNLKEEVRLAEINLATKTGHMELATQRLAEVQYQITKLSAIDLSGIASIRPTPRVGKKEHGALRQTILEVMKSGRAIRTVDLIRLMAPIFEWDLSTLKGRRYAKEAVRGPLRRFEAMGVVERLPDALSDLGQPCGVWRWIGPIDGDTPSTP